MTREALWIQSPLPNWKKELLFPSHSLHDDGSASSMGNSSVSNLVTIDFYHRCFLQRWGKCLNAPWLLSVSVFVMVLSWSLGSHRDPSYAELPTNTGQDIFHGPEGQHLRIIGCICITAEPSVKIQKYHKLSCIPVSKSLTYLVRIHSLASASL